MRSTLLFILSLFIGESNISFANMLDTIKVQKNIQQSIIDLIVDTEKARVIGLADKYLTEKPITITDNSCSRSAGGKHDYFSEGEYWWPDSLNPDGPYIRRDGLNNPQNFTFHRKALGQFANLVGTLSSAYLLTGDEKYVKSALKHLNAWFVDTSTRMNPHLLYAQAIKGICTGRGIGIIDATSFIEVAISVSVFEKSPYASAAELYSIKNWFKDFLYWLTTHQYGIDEMNWENNHGTWWHAQAAAYARLTGNIEVLELCKQNFKDRLLPKQMAANGSFPLELERTKPFSYSLYNLEAMSTLAWLISDHELNYWDYKLPDGRGIYKGLDFILPYMKNKESWPYAKDISNWDNQPGRIHFLLFAAILKGNRDYFNIWEKIDEKLTEGGIQRNSTIKNPVLWLGLDDPLKEKTFTNPIIPGFNPDPSICRVKDNFYLVTSTFEYFPGVPVYHSKDLVNWKMIGHVLNRASQLNLDIINCSGGIYAPTIRYNKGTYYMITTLVGGQNVHKNFIATAKKPEGPWSEPHWIADAPGIDPSLFFDDDGKVYYSGNISPQTKLWDKHRNIWVQEIDLKKWELIGKRVEVLDGGEYYKKGTLDGSIETGVNNYEASHIYKKDGKYYLLIAHGGTSQNHAVSIWRSNHVFGPYKPNPSNPILTHRHLSKEHPYTSTGHADLVETKNGEWWMVYLAKRPYGGENHIMGRETFLSPVDWQGEWPVVNPNGNKAQGEVVHFKPNIKENKFTDVGSKDEFDAAKLQPNWTFIRTPRTEWWSLNSRKGFLRIQLRPEMVSQKANPSFIGKRQEHKNFSATLKMEFKPQSDKEEAGFVVERDKDYYLKYTLGLENKIPILKLTKRVGESSKDTLVAKLALEKNIQFLKISAKGVFYSFSYSMNGTDWTVIKENFDARLLGLAGAGRFTGTFIGMYASSNGEESKNFVDFDWFKYEGE